MPLIGSSAKRQRQNEVRRQRNRMTVSAVRTARKKFLAAVAAKDKDSAGKLLHVAQKLIDSATGKGIFKRNTAARLKSRLHQRYNGLDVE